MGDFVQSTNVKSAVRKLANPVEDVTAFNALVQSVITANPFACVAYTSGSVSHEPVEKTKETYAAKFVYSDADAKKRGTGSHSFDSVAGYNAGIPVLEAVTALNTAHNGTPAHDAAKDTFSATLKCRDPNGETYNLVLNRDSVHLTSYTDEAIKTRVEAWADSVPELA
jgi:hypothetical protein